MDLTRVIKLLFVSGEQAAASLQDPYRMMSDCWNDNLSQSVETEPLDSRGYPQGLHVSRLLAEAPGPTPELFVLIRHEHISVCKHRLWVKGAAAHLQRGPG